MNKNALCCALIVAAYFLFGIFPLSSYASNKNYEICQEKYLSKAAAQKIHSPACASNYINASLIGVMEKDEGEITMIEDTSGEEQYDAKIREGKAVLCKALARKEWLDSVGGDNLEQRQVLFDCLKNKYISSRKAILEILDPTMIKPNSMGVQLERNNIWFYRVSSEGKQEAGVNIYYPESTLISWIVVGFHPSNCGSSEGYEWSLRLKLPTPMPVNQNAIWTWDMPEGIKFTDQSCLDILAAG